MNERPGTAPSAPRDGARADRIGPVPLAPARGLYLCAGKRLFDALAAAIGLILLAPIIALIALAIRLDSPGPVIYRSRRVGEGGRVFRFYKFRSMVRDAEALRAALNHLNEVEGPVFKIQRDPRATRVGAWLRRTSVDELPQLWNVLKGDMSLVGPRPPIPEEVVQYEPWQLRRLSVRPGITCLWQVSGRSGVSFDEWMRMDMEYVERRSFRTDLSILLRTIPAVLSRRGAF